MSGRPSVLLTLADVPWPAVAGKRLRAAQTLAPLAELADLDVAVLFAGERGSHLLPPDVAVRDVVHVPALARPPLQAAARAAVGCQPWRLAVQDWGEAGRALLPLGDRRYDLVWFGSMEHLWHLDRLGADRRVVVDVDDVESVKIRSFLRARRLTQAGWVDRLQRALELPLWLRIERRVRARADAAVVCSEQDRARFGGPRTVVVPNTYPDLGRLAAPGGGATPVLSMLGTYTNEPVADAAFLAARAVLPRVREHHPDARLRLAGRGDHLLAPLSRLPGVDVVGPVEDARRELSAADVVLAPFPWGGGTKLKVIEALALGVPVVTTTHGREGLEAVPGVHLLVGDSPRELAEACLALLSDVGLARRLAESGRALYEQHHRPEVAARAVMQVVERVLSGGAPRGAAAGPEGDEVDS